MTSETDVSFCSSTKAAHLALSSRASREEEIKSLSKEKMAKSDVYENVSPLMGAIIQRNLLQQVCPRPHPSAAFPDVPSHPPPSLSGTLRKIGYLYLRLPVPQT